MVLSGQFGAGHHQAARALQIANQRAAIFDEIEIFDVMEIIHPRWHELGKQLFEHVIFSFPSLYGYIYRNTRHSNAFHSLLQRMGRLFCRRLSQWIEQQRPVAIVSTFPLASLLIGTLKASRRMSLPFVSILTDHTDHGVWIQPHTDLFCVGSEFTRQMLQNKGLPSTKIAVTGIPISPCFQDCAAYRDSFLTSHRLQANRPLVVLMGGGCGMIHREMLQLLENARQLDAYQWAVVCGHNAKLFQRLSARYSAYPHIRITGYIEPIHELMAAADLLVTKPGGLTTSEALSVELPMLLTEPSPGQEQENAAFLCHSGAALMAPEGRLQDTVESILQQQTVLKKMKQQAQLIKKPFASLDALIHLQRLTASVESSVHCKAAASSTFINAIHDG